MPQRRRRPNGRQLYVSRRGGRRRSGLYIARNLAAWLSLTGKVSLRCLSLMQRCPLPSRSRPAIALALTTVCRCTCQNTAGSSCSISSRKRHPDHRLAVRRHHRRVLVVRAEIADLADGDQPDLATLRRGDPAQMAAVARLGQALQQAVEPRRRAADALLQAPDRGGEPRRRERLQHVVDGPLLERLDGVLVERRHEDDVAAAVDLARDLDPRQPRHLDVEEEDVGRVLVERTQRLDAVLDRGADQQLGPQLGECVAQALRPAGARLRR